MEAGKLFELDYSVKRNYKKTYALVCNHSHPSFIPERMTTDGKTLKENEVKTSIAGNHVKIAKFETYHVGTEQLHKRSKPNQHKKISTSATATNPY